MLDKTGLKEALIHNILELSLKYFYRTVTLSLEEKEITRDRTACLERDTSGNGDWRTRTDKRKEGQERDCWELCY